MGRDGHSGRRQRHVRLARGLLLPLLLLTVAAPPPLGALAAAGPVAQVPGGSEVATVTLTEVEPAVVALDDVLTLSGVLTNTGDAPLVDPLPALRWSSDPLQSLDDVDLVAANPLFRYGLVDYRFSETLPTLEPGAQTAFTLEVNLDQLPLRSGVHVFGVDVLASLPDGLRVFVADARTTVPVDIDVDDPLPVALIWPLAAAPTLLPDGRLVDTSLAAELAPGGRLETLARLAGDAPVTWVIDPDLVRTVAAMADGYQTAGSDAEGSGAADAQTFLADLAASISADSDVRAIPAADPDVGGSLATGIRSSVVEEVVADGLDDSALDTLVGRAVPQLTLLADRPVTTAMLGVYLRAGISTTVLARPATTATTTVGPSSTSLEGTPALARLDRPRGRDVDVFVAGVPPEASVSAETTQPIAMRQWMLSSSALLAAADPTPAAAWVVAPPVQWVADAAAAEALLDTWQGTDWIATTALSAIPRADTTISLIEDAEPVPISSTTRTTLAALAADVDRLQPLFVEPPLAPEEMPRATARATSYAWQQAPEQGQVYLDALVTAVTSGEDDLSLVVAPTITLSSRSGRFPVSIVNASNVDVEVGVRFTSQNSSRLRVEDVEPMVLTAGEKRTITATALATANGRLQVQAALVTTQGGTVGTPATTLVTVTNVGALGWGVIAAGGVLLAAALARSRLRRRGAETPQ